MKAGGPRSRANARDLLRLPDFQDRLLFFVAETGGMLGEVWSWIGERYQIGNSHMCCRAQRLIWSRHPTALFTGAIVIFWLAALEIFDHST
jgi:hypothetical protein